ncbi:MAG: hypothetical protein ACM3JJ_12995 [Hyphomicrobiales bacterium]
MRRASSGFADRARGGAVLVALLLAALGARAGAAPLWDPAAVRSAAVPAGVRVLVASGAPDAAATTTALERAGYRVHVVLLPSTYYVSAGPRAGALPAGLLDAPEARGAPAAAGGAPGGAPPLLAPSTTEPVSLRSLFGDLPDALPPLEPGSSGAPSRDAIAPANTPLPSGLFYGTRWEDTSEFMIGRVAVPILFPESDGSTDPNHYDWTPALRDSVVRSAVRGLLKWSVHAASRNLTLTWMLEVRADLATRYEPIDRPIGQEELWIADVLQTLVGYRGSAVTMAYDYANAARGRLGAQWTTILFPVQNDTSAVGTFPDGYIAHARLGGPWFVLPVNNLNTKSATLDYYVEHEVTHLFWALDEYPSNSAWWTCTLTTGYFNQPNTNSSIPAPGYCNVPVRQCLMTGNYPDSICGYTDAQVGWADRDKDGILDLYQTRPLVKPDSAQYRTGAGVPITLRGKAGDQAFPNQNPYRYFTGDSITVSTIDSVQYRFDGGPWTDVPCRDGACDSGNEPFTVVLPPPTTGSHTVEWRAWNRNGLTDLVPAVTAITIGGGAGPIAGSGDGVSAAPRLTAAPTPARGPVRFALRAAPGARGRARVVDVLGRTVRTWPVTVPDGGILAWDWDLRSRGGGPAASGLYFVVVEIADVTLTQRVLVFR